MHIKKRRLKVQNLNTVEWWTYKYLYSHNKHLLVLHIQEEGSKTIAIDFNSSAHCPMLYGIIAFSHHLGEVKNWVMDLLLQWTMQRVKYQNGSAEECIMIYERCKRLHHLPPVRPTLLVSNTPLGRLTLLMMLSHDP